MTDAHAAADRASSLATDAPSRLSALQLLAETSLQLGDSQTARRHADSAREIAESLVERDTTPANRVALGDALVGLGQWWFVAGDRAAAKSHYARAIELAKDLVTADENYLDAWRLRAMATLGLGDVAMDTDVTEANGHYADAYRITSWLRQKTETIDAVRNQAVAYQKLADVVTRRGDLLASFDMYFACVDLNQQLVEADPDNMLRSRNLAVALMKRGEVLSRRGFSERATDDHDQAIALLSKAAAVDARNVSIQRDLLFARLAAGIALGRTSGPARALPHFTNSIEIARRLATLDETNVGAQRDLVNVLLAAVSIRESKIQRADVVAAIQELAKRGPLTTGEQEFLKRPR
jgi:tetratricopeptide (TPR) repeat protein